MNELLFPAHAGVIPYTATQPVGFIPFPRTRGGDPVHYFTPLLIVGFSPHTRG